MPQDKYKGLKEKLKDTQFPSLYMFKFIILNELELLAEVKALAINPSSISSNRSKNGKYLSVTFKELKNNADEIIDIYIKAENIEGIIAL